MEAPLTALKNLEPKAVEKVRGQQEAEVLRSLSLERETTRLPHSTHKKRTLSVEAVHL